MNNLKSFLKSFVYAFNGIVTCIKKERNMRIHICFTVYMFCYLLIYDFFTVSRTQLALLCVMCAVVIGGELVNTAVERAVDLYGSEHTENGKIAKDCAAGAVLVSAVFAVGCGIAILWQPEAFRSMFSYYAENPVMLAVLAASLVLSVVFVFRGPVIRKRK